MRAVTVEAPEELARVIDELNLTLDFADLESVLNYNLADAGDEIGAQIYTFACESHPKATADDIRRTMAKIAALLVERDKLDEREKLDRAEYQRLHGPPNLAEAS